MGNFIDPRDNPTPPVRRLAVPSEDLDQLDELARLCERGRIYEVERWIRDGKPIYAIAYLRTGKRRVKNALAVAMETNQFDLALLLLCNGFPPDVGGHSLLDDAVSARKMEYAELLLAWGADRMLVDPYTILDSYDTALYDRFWSAGLDFTRNHELARMLSAHSSNRPAYGWARRHKDDPKIARELSIALLQAVVENRERAVALLMWAGADPRQPVRDLRFDREDDAEAETDWSTPLEHALIYGHGHLLKMLKLKPDVDDFDRLWTSACDEAAVEALLRVKVPSNWSKVLVRNLEAALSSYRGDAARRIVEKLTVDHGARLTAMTASEVDCFRREILRCRDESRCRWVLRWMSYGETCDPSIFAEVTRTPSMQAKLRSLRIHDARYR